MHALSIFYSDLLSLSFELVVCQIDSLRRCVTGSTSIRDATTNEFMVNIGERLNDDTLKQQAWTILNTNTVGVWPAATQVGGTDVPNPVTEVSGLITYSRGCSDKAGDCPLT